MAGSTNFGNEGACDCSGVGTIAGWAEGGGRTTDAGTKRNALELAEAVLGGGAMVGCRIGPAVDGLG